MNEHRPDWKSGKRLQFGVRSEQLEGCRDVKQLRQHAARLRLALRHFTEGGQVERPLNLPIIEIRGMFDAMAYLYPAAILPRTPSIEELRTFTGCDAALTEAARWCDEVQEVLDRQNGPPPITQDDARILLALLSMYPATHTQEGLEGNPTVNLSVRTITKRLSHLEGSGLVERPLGPKGGYGLTRKGKLVAEQL